MKTRLFALLLVWTAASTGQAAFELSRSIAPAVPTFDPLAPQALFWLANPALLSLAGARAGGGYARPHGVAGLDIGFAGWTIPASRLVFGLSGTTLGQSALYRESDLALGVGLRAGHGLSVGGILHWLDLRFGTRFPAVRSGAASLGIWFRSAGRVGGGVAVSDLWSARVSGRRLVRPALRAAVSYRHSPLAGLRAGLERRDRWVWSVGETVLVAEPLHLHADLLSAPLRILVGARLRTGPVYVDFTYREHTELGGDFVWCVGWVRR